MPKASEPAPAGGAEALAVPWLALGGGTNTSSESKQKDWTIPESTPASQAGRAVPQGCTGRAPGEMQLPARILTGVGGKSSQVERCGGG